MSSAITCFLIDDDVDDQDIFILALGEVDKSIHCHVASDAADALKRLGSGELQPDFIFLDLNMPRMNGKQCLSHLKKIDFLTDIPVIIYSTSSDLRDKNETEQLGAADYIVKPNSVSALAEILARFFKVTERMS
ncbi:MAG: response regulator [Bacteroidetes bacterium]|nr:response regulator [Bacteroidota bacterium]